MSLILLGRELCFCEKRRTLCVLRCSTQLCKHGKLAPRQGSVLRLYKAGVPQIIRVVCQAAADWHPCSLSVHESADHRVHCPQIEQSLLFKPKSKGLYLVEGSGPMKNNRTHCNTVMEETNGGRLCRRWVLRCLVGLVLQNISIL